MTTYYSWLVSQLRKSATESILKKQSIYYLTWYSSRQIFISLTHFRPKFHFNISRKCQKILHVILTPLEPMSISINDVNGFKWKSKTQVTSYELQVQIHELRVQIREIRVQMYELRVQIHELEDWKQELQDWEHKLGN